MEKKEKDKYEKMAKIIKATAHPSRLFIIEKLKEKSHCVQELTAMIGADISTVSKHLAVLKKEKIVSSEKRGNCVFYHLRCGCILEIYYCILNVIKENDQEVFENITK